MSKKLFLLAILIEIVISTTALAATFSVQNENANLTWCADIIITGAPAVSSLSEMLRMVGLRLEQEGYSVEYHLTYFGDPDTGFINFENDVSDGTITFMGFLNNFKASVVMSFDGHRTNIIDVILRTINFYVNAD